MIYDFYCEVCHLSKVVHRLVKDRNEVCLCDGCQQPMIRLIGTPSFIFKGSGFYETDYKHNKDMQKEAKKLKKKIQ